MANYHLEISIINRGNGGSVARYVNYIGGHKVHDSYTGRSYYSRRSDIVMFKIYQPSDAPDSFHDIQMLCDKIEEAENRFNSRTARTIIGSLPNELPYTELRRIVDEYIEHNFIEAGLCAIAAIHKGLHKDNPAKNNPHVHIIVSTRTVGSDGFSKTKFREYDKRKYVEIWRERWAAVQNKAYERNGISTRISHESLYVQGQIKKKSHYLHRIEWQRKHNGEHLHSQDKCHDILLKNHIKEHEPDHSR